MSIRSNLILAAVALALSTTAAAQPRPPRPPRPAKYDVPFSAPQNFIDHARVFAEETIKVGPHNVWTINTPGGGIGNIAFVEGTDGVVVIDTGVGIEFAKRANEKMRAITQKPVVAIVYTHHHADHIAGANVFATAADVASGKVKVIAAENFVQEAALENAAVGPIMGVRAAYMYGLMLPKDAEATHFHVGCCGFKVAGTNGFLPPNTRVPLQGTTEMTLAGFRMQFFHTGGEAASHIAIYLPDQRIAFVGDEFQGPTFPQLHSLRGTRPRDIERWFTAIDRVRAFKPDYVVPGHGPTINGAAEIEKILTDYRDAMQLVLDQSIRLINQGKTPDELAETVRLPKTAQKEPWGIEYYGNVDVSARNVYGGLISWWNGDPAELRPTPRMERAKRQVAMMGGRDKVFEEAERAFFKGDPQWAAELTTPLIRIDRNDWNARFLKAAALRTIGYAQTSSTLRGFYLSGALEIEGAFDPLAIQRRISAQLSDPATLPAQALFTLWRYRVNFDRASGKTASIGWHLNDTNEDFTLNLRNNILEVLPRRIEPVDARIDLTRAQLGELFAGKVGPTKAGRVSGNVNVVETLFAILDRPEDAPVPHTALR